MVQSKRGAKKCKRRKKVVEEMQVLFWIKKEHT